jgi:hypothetical protein
LVYNSTNIIISFKVRKVIKIADSIREKLNIRDEGLLISNYNSSKAKRSSNSKILEELNLYNKTMRSFVLSGLLFLLFFVIITIVIGVISVK